MEEELLFFFDEEDVTISASPSIKVSFSSISLISTSSTPCVILTCDSVPLVCELEPLMLVDSVLLFLLFFPQPQNNIVIRQRIETKEIIFFIYYSVSYPRNPSSSSLILGSPSSGNGDCVKTSNISSLIISSHGLSKSFIVKTPPIYLPRSLNLAVFTSVEKLYVVVSPLLTP